MAANEWQGVVIRQCEGGNCDKNILYIWSMIDVSILVLNNAVPAAIADASYVFTMVNDFM